MCKASACRKDRDMILGGHAEAILSKTRKG